MQTAYYLLASIAAVVVIIGVTVMTVRMVLLMARVERTRKEFMQTISEVELSLKHANRLLVQFQEGADHLRHALERLERVLDIVQPATAFGGLLAGARRIMSGRRPVSGGAGSSEESKEHSHG